MRWASARCSAWRSSSVFLITSTAWGPEAVCVTCIAYAAWNWRTCSSSACTFPSKRFPFSSASSSSSSSSLFRLAHISSVKARSSSCQVRSVAHFATEASLALRFSSARAMSLALSASSYCSFCSFASVAVCLSRCFSSTVL
jgi:hypothetical protein